MPLSAERKAEYFETMKGHMSNYSKMFIVEVDNVGSKQIQQTRVALRGKAEILMGKVREERPCRIGNAQELTKTVSSVILLEHDDEEVHPRVRRGEPWKPH